MKSDIQDNVYNLSYEELAQFIRDQALPSYRTDQIWRWLYDGLAADFRDMTTLPNSMREMLRTRFSTHVASQVHVQKSADGKTVKVLFRLIDGSFIEAVLMKYERRNTVCISTQAGCAMGCVFCATGQMGFLRNLSKGEITGQVLYFARFLAKTGERISNVVFMGMGEPLHNYENSLRAVDTLTHPLGFNLGARRLTISTVGLVPGIRRFAEERRQVTLAVSLHAASDEERDRLIPINQRWPLSELMNACRYYISRTRRRITFEWALIADENDTAEQAAALGGLIQGMLCHVNLIPVNPTSGYTGKPSSKERVRQFQEELRLFGIDSSVRVRRGIDIDAGCGQLRERYVSETPTT